MKLVLITVSQVIYGEREVKHCPPVVAFFLQRLSRRIKHAVVLAGTVGGHHTATVLIDQT